jgi:EAL domain-containing protein (putative c-di-GMP-specific phosphodiesterase class I)
MLELAHGIGVRVVAEGVEDQSSRDWLIAAGCDAAQGYYFQRPAPWPELAERFAPLPSHRSAVAEPATRQTVEVVRT